MGGNPFARRFFGFIRPFRHHIRICHPQLVLVFALGVIVGVVLYPSRENITPYSTEYVHSGLVFGEVLLPALVGWLAASLVLRDYFLEVVLTTPYLQTRLVLERLAVFVVTAIVAWIVFLTVVWWQAARPETPFVELILANLSTTFLFGSIGLWGSLRLRTWIGAGLVVTLVLGGRAGISSNLVGPSLVLPILDILSSRVSRPSVLVGKSAIAERLLRNTHC